MAARERKEEGGLVGDSTNRFPALWLTGQHVTAHMAGGAALGAAPLAVVSQKLVCFRLLAAAGGEAATLLRPDLISPVRLGTPTLVCFFFPAEVILVRLFGSSKSCWRR